MQYKLPEGAEDPWMKGKIRSPTGNIFPLETHSLQLQYRKTGETDTTPNSGRGKTGCPNTNPRTFLNTGFRYPIHRA